MKITVRQFSRKPSLGAFSIERVFADINGALTDDISIEWIENRYRSGGFLPRLRDALRARRLAGQVNHVLGDVHYLTFFMPRRRTILTIHDCEMITRARGLKRFLLYLLWLYLPLRRARFVVAISEQTRNDIIQLANAPPAQIRVISNPVSASFRLAPPPAPDDFATILHIGTKANKNLERLIEAARGMPLRLLIVGRLSDTQAYLLETSGVEYENHQYCTDAEIVACYTKANALAFVSLSEGFGLPILEAQAVGRPVLTSDREPMRSVARPKGALFVDPEDVTAIRCGLERIIGDAELRGRLVAAGLRNVERYRPEAVAARYAELYREVASVS
jgi:glycosyltransferase involved in cell wall biosynthesis